MTTRPPFDNPAAPSGPELGDLTVDRDADVPIGVQLAWALRVRIGEGELAPGQRLPGLRDLAEATGVNVNTVRSVYQRLEQEGLIDSQQGSGTFVAATAQASSSVGAIAANAAREARETGIDPREVAAALYSARESPTDAAEQAAERRRLLRAQIGVLERTLNEMEVAHPGVVPPARGKRRGIGPALLNAHELEQVRAHLVRRLATVQAAIDAQLAPDADTQQPASSAGRASDPKPVKARAQAKPSAARKPKRAQPPTGGTSPAPAGA